MSDRIDAQLARLLAETTSRSGYEREQAVLTLGCLRNPASIPYLVVRANDWVAQVRTAAYAALIGMLEPPFVRAFVAALPQIQHLMTCGRADHAELLRV